MSFNAFLRGAHDPERFIFGAQPLASRREGDFLCVNPLTWRFPDHSLSTANPGSKRLMWLLGMLQLSSWSPPLVENHFSAQCASDGSGILLTDALFAWDPVSVHGFLLGPVFPGGNVHGSETQIYWKSIRENAATRLAAWQEHPGR